MFHINARREDGSLRRMSDASGSKYRYVYEDCASYAVLNPGVEFVITCDHTGPEFCKDCGPKEDSSET